MHLAGAGHLLRGNVLTFDQRHTSVATDFTHGLGEILTATLGDLPEGDFSAYSQTVFKLTGRRALQLRVSPSC